MDHVFVGVTTGGVGVGAAGAGVDPLPPQADNDNAIAPAIIRGLAVCMEAREMIAVTHSRINALSGDLHVQSLLVMIESAHAPAHDVMPAVDKSPDRIAAMFDAIAGKYDFLNHLLSAGLDTRWRARAIRALHLRADARVLDVCTGTADLAIAAAGAASGARILGVDFAGAMLRLGFDKLRARALQSRVSLVQGDATKIPVRGGWADAATIGFGIRNVADPAAALRELARVLTPGGRLAILEFGEPRIRGIRSVYNWYFRAVLPRLGRLVSRHQSAYSYLPASVGSFPRPAEFAATISSQGFSDVRAVPISFGIVYLYTATRRTNYPGAHLG